MASGMGVSEEVVTKFSEMKLRRTAKWLLFKIQEDRIVLEDSGSGDAKEFISKLPSHDCRYGVFDCDTKIQFVMWCPDVAPVKPRMLYASSKDALIKKLDGATPTALEAHEVGELNVLQK